MGLGEDQTSSKLALENHEQRTDLNNRNRIIRGISGTRNCGEAWKQTCWRNTKHRRKQFAFVSIFLYIFYHISPQLSLCFLIFIVLRLCFFFSSMSPASVLRFSVMRSIIFSRTIYCRCPAQVIFCFFFFLLQSLAIFCPHYLYYFLSLYFSEYQHFILCFCFYIPYNRFSMSSNLIW